jgi:predicted ArsR family transcriptional regulator
MAPQATSAGLNVQPRQRRDVYHALGKGTEGRSVKDLLADVDMPEHDLRESLRKLHDAGLAQRTRATWRAVSIDGADPEISPASDDCASF